MNTELIFNYIIIGVIFALVIHLAFKFFRPEYSELLVNNSENFTDLKKCNINKNYLKDNKKTIDESVSKLCSKDCKINAESESEELSNQQMPFKNKNTVFDSELQIDDHIRRSLVNDTIANKATKNYTRNEIDEYRNKFFSFNNSINQTSHNDDMVDRINDLYLSGSTDIAKNHNGIQIKDLYDQLTKQEY